jgi:cytochrome P450
MIDFLTNVWTEVLEVYGPCISTAGLDDWPRHRKVLASPFNESIMNFVWAESIAQTQRMLQAWTGPKAEPGIASIAKDTRTLSLNVLAAIGFRKSYQFQSAQDSTDSTDSDVVSSYRDALQTVLDNAIPLMLVPYRYLLHPWAPKSWARVGQAGAEFKAHMVRMLDEENAAFVRGESGSGGLMTSFLRALNSHEQQSQIDPSISAKGMTVDEIFGNIFVINFAGHDTTANTLAFSLLLLAAHPTVQEWVSEEIRLAITDPDMGKQSYQEIFPKLIRCRAVLVRSFCTYRQYRG